MLDSDGIVDVENLKRNATDGRRATKFRTNPIEMLGPRVGARMEQPCEPAVVGVESRNVRPLMRIAAEAGEGQIGLDRGTRVLLGDDMIDAERQRIPIAGHRAVFALAARALENKSAKRGIHGLVYLGAWPACLSESRARACSNARKFPTRR